MRVVMVAYVLTLYDDDSRCPSDHHGASLWRERWHTESAAKHDVQGKFSNAMMDDHAQRWA